MAKSSKLGGKIIALIILLAIIGGGIYYWQRSEERPPEVTEVKVSRGNVIQSITATGIIQAPTSVDVSSQISGQIIDVRVDYNDKVKQGDVLARLDPATYKSKLLQAEAQFANTQASQTLTRLNTERTRELFQKNLVSQADLDQAEAQLLQANAQLQIQQANVESANTDLSRCTIYAPINGIVLDRQTDVGKTVAASLNAPTLFTLITDLTKMEISADVSEADIGNVAVDQEVNFTVDAYPGRQFRGKITQIRNLPKTAQSVVVYGTIISVDNADLRLKPGMTANVSIITARRDNVLKIANAALRARIPEQYMPAAPAKTDAEASANATQQTPPAQTHKGGGSGNPNAQAAFALARELGISRGQPVTPELVERFKATAAERSIAIPEPFLARLMENMKTGSVAVTTTRTIYRVVTPAPNLKIEALTIRCGISDGTTTEVQSGLNENDSVISSIFIPGSTASAPAAGGNSNPFGGNRSLGR